MTIHEWKVEENRKVFGWSVHLRVGVAKTVVVLQCDAGLTRPSTAVVINCNHFCLRVLINFIFHSCHISSQSVISQFVHSAVIIDHDQSVQFHFREQLHLSFFLYLPLLHYFTRPSFHPSQQSCHPPDPLFAALPPPPLHNPFPHCLLLSLSLNIALWEVMWLLWSWAL